MTSFTKLENEKTRPNIGYYHVTLLFYLRNRRNEVLIMAMLSMNENEKYQKRVRHTYTTMLDTI